MDKGLREFLEKLQSILLEGQKKLEEGQRRLEDRQSKLEEGQKRLEERQFKLEEGQRRLEERQSNLEAGLKEIKDLLIELESKNAERHLEIKMIISELRKDLFTVETITASNYADIIKLKKKVE